MQNETEEAKSSNSNKRKKQYIPTLHKRKRFIVEPGLKGFLCTCNFRERECIRECYNILNEYADIMYGPNEPVEQALDIEEDMDGLLKEIESLKAESNTVVQRFQVVESGAKNFLFIRSNIEDPVGLAEAIVKDINNKKKQKTRFLLRLIPIEATCKANVDDIQKACEPLLKKHFTDVGKTFSIVFNHRHNNSISKDQVITTVADMVSATRSDHSVNLKDAEISIVIEIIKGMALIGMVPNFTKYKKYNLLKICEAESENANIKVDKDIAPSIVSAEAVSV